MSKKILVIDDEPDIVKVVTARLQSAGYQTAVAFNGLEGLEKLKIEKPDLIILDVIMPQMDGYTFVKEIKSKHETKNIPIIMLSAKDKMKDLFAIEGVKDYIVKPFESEELLWRVSKSLNEGQAE